MIKRDYSTTMPVGGDCESTVAEDLKADKQIRNVSVVQTPTARVEEVLVSGEYASVSWIILGDRTSLELLYGSHGPRASEREIESAKSLMTDMEGRIRRACPAAEDMVLISEYCSTNLDC